MTYNQVIKKVDHVNIRVENIEESVSFYTDVLGFQVVGQKDMRPSANSVSTYVARDGFEFELAWGHDLSQCASKGLIDHFALEVQDIYGAMQYFKEQNANVISNVIPVNNDFLCFFVLGPAGEKIEVIQYL